MSTKVETFMTQMKRNSRTFKEVKEATAFRISYKTKTGWKRLINSTSVNSTNLQMVAITSLIERQRALFASVIKACTKAQRRSQDAIFALLYS